METNATLTIRMTRDEMLEAVEGFIQFGKVHLVTPRGVQVTLVRENGSSKRLEGKVKVAIEGAEKGVRAG